MITVKKSPDNFITTTEQCFTVSEVMKDLTKFCGQVKPNFAYTVAKYKEGNVRITRQEINRPSPPFRWILCGDDKELSRIIDEMVCLKLKLTILEF